MRVEAITSPQNSKIKEVVALVEKSKLRRGKSLFVVEGIREITACIKNNYIIESIFFNPDIAGEEISKYPDIQSYINNQDSQKTAIYSVSSPAYTKMAYRESTEGVIAIVNEKKYKLDDLDSSKTPLLLICEHIEKPGNLGAMLRTADACNLTGIIICDPLTDLYNPNIIRASLGAIFTKKVITCTNEEAYTWLKQNNIQILTAQLQDSSYYYNINMTIPTAIVMGSEALGLTDFWRKVSDAKIKIPMLGEMDSLNVSVSAAVLCYEAIRQRENK